MALLAFLHGVCPAAEPPPLMLAMDYDGQPPGEYWVSEKLDGVRAHWDGERLLSRQGNVFPAPPWFVEDFPDVSLDGELWLGRSRFEELSGIVRRHEPSPAWRDVRFMVFDLPVHGATFDERLARLRTLLSASPSAYIALVEQSRVADAAGLQARLDAVVAAGGEGLMLHHQDALYVAGRTASLRKLKPFNDAEACVLAHLPGEGRLDGLLGSLLVATPAGRRFRIGTGLTDAQRADPPAVGSVVTYRHRGFTNSGLPRFASFLRVRYPPESGQCTSHFRGPGG